MSDSDGDDETGFDPLAAIKKATQQVMDAHKTGNSNQVGLAIDILNCTWIHVIQTGAYCDALRKQVLAECIFKPNLSEHDESDKENKSQGGHESEDDEDDDDEDNKDKEGGKKKKAGGGNAGGRGLPRPLPRSPTPSTPPSPPGSQSPPPSQSPTSNQSPIEEEVSTSAQAQAKRLRDEQTKMLQNAPRDDEESDDEQSKGGKLSPRDEEESDPESDDNEGRANKRTKPNNTPTKAKAKPAPTEPSPSPTEPSPTELSPSPTELSPSPTELSPSPTEPTEEEKRQRTIVKARTYFLDLRDDISYESEYILLRLPSFMDLTEGKIERAFSDQSRFPDIVMRHWFKDILYLNRLGMCAATLFYKTAAVKGVRMVIRFGSLAQMAITLEESMSRSTDDSVQYKHLHYALKHAVDSGEFDDLLPSNKGIPTVGKHLLSLNEMTRNHLLTFTYAIAGCHAFRLVSMSHLTKGEVPILSKSVLRILGCNADSPPTSTRELLKLYKMSFDSNSVSLDDKKVLMESFLIITDTMRGISNEKWKEVDETEIQDNQSSTRTTSTTTTTTAATTPKPYFAGKGRTNDDRKDRAALALLATIASKFIYQLTHKSVEYDGHKGLLSLLLRTSMEKFHRNANKLKMAKVYNGLAPEEYLISVYDGIEELVTIARTGSGRGKGTSDFSNDVAMLFLKSWSIDERLGVMGYDPSGDEEEESSDDEE